jgi:hypothetical protein
MGRRSSGRVPNLSRVSRAGARSLAQRGQRTISADPEMIQRGAHLSNTIAHFALDFFSQRSVCGGHGQQA